MQTAVTFKGLDPSDALKAYVSDKLNRFDRFLASAAEANAVLKVEKFRHIAEIHISGDRLSITGSEETDDMYSAIDMVLDKLEKQIKKSKQKHRAGRSSATIKGPTPMLSGEESPEEAEREIRVVDIEYKPMDVDEAVMQLNLSSDHFLVFTNARSDRVNVLYRRNDGHFGLIQPRR
ncbi:MAG: ribosome-associated translation inhibitor RaiA [Desulfosarcinaceae bacterium]|nr:ribosome-associated translation inhibitor RaiA [Desulfosarcinaceae bacterium]